MLEMLFDFVLGNKTCILLLIVQMLLYKIKFALKYEGFAVVSLKEKQNHEIHRIKIFELTYEKIKENKRLGICSHRYHLPILDASNCLVLLDFLNLKFTQNSFSKWILITNLIFSKFTFIIEPSCFSPETPHSTKCKKDKSTTSALIIFSELFGGRATSTIHYNNILKLHYTLQQPVGYFYKAPPSTMQRMDGLSPHNPTTKWQKKSS